MGEPIRLSDGANRPGGARSAPGLLNGVGSLVDSAREAGLDVELHTAGEAVPLPSPVDAAAYRIIQEALTNILRHSGASRATVRVDTANGVLTIEVIDDGRGVDPAVDPLATGGHGLAGMRERATALGGRLHAMNVASGGFTIRAELPIRLRT